MGERIFGFSQTNLALVVRRCQEEVGRGAVQVVTLRDQPSPHRRCYVVLGVRTLDAARCRMLSESTGVVVVVDALPALKRIRGIRVLDAVDSPYWVRGQPRFAALTAALRGRQAPVGLEVGPDDALAAMIAAARERGLLDKVLSAARVMGPVERGRLHADVAHALAGRLSIRALRRRCERRGARGRAYEDMLLALAGPTARRLGEALRDRMRGDEAAAAALRHDVEASEVRFLAAHLVRAERR